MNHRASIGIPPSTTTATEPSPDFSVVLGGPLFQLLRKAGLGTSDGMELLVRRLVFFVGITWLPLLLLSAVVALVSGRAPLGFLRDIEVHVRFLVALPALIIAELVVHRRMLPVARRFIERRLVPDEDRQRFDRAVESAVALRNSIPLEVALFVTVYTVGLWFWHDRFALDTATWYAKPGGRWQLTAAGFWYVFISIPILQFLLLRWYVRLFIWYRFLWQVSRITLNLIPTHPDRAGGLGFLGTVAYALGPLLFAQGAMLSGLIASRVLYHAEQLLDFKMQAAGFVVFFVAVIFGPLLVFTPQMAEARRKGLATYGLLAQRYVRAFQDKWVVGFGPAAADELLGTGDIQSLADLGNSYTVVQEMRMVPFGMKDMWRLALSTAAPMVPLLLLVWSPEEVIREVIKIVF